MVQRSSSSLLPWLVLADCDCKGKAGQKDMMRQQMLRTVVDATSVSGKLVQPVPPEPNASRKEQREQGRKRVVRTVVVGLLTPPSPSPATIRRRLAATEVLEISQ